MSDISEGLPRARITSGPASWQVLQRESDGRATISVAGIRVSEEDVPVLVRVAREYDGGSAAGCDWREAEMLPGNKWQATMRIPTGGLYSIETRLCAYASGDRIWHVAVGDVWVIAGQSNAVGYGHGPVVDPPMLGVSVFGLNEQWRLAAHPIFDSTGTKHPANYDVGWVDVSPWLAFAKVILKRAGVPVGLVPAAMGGALLCAWDSGDPGGEPFLFDNMNSLIEAAGGKIAGMLWYQGCSETHEMRTAADYYQRFVRFVTAVRERHGRDLPIITAQINRYTEAPEERQEPWSLMRDAQRRAAREIPNLAVVPTLDIPTSDGVHNSAAGNVCLGERFARTALGMVYGHEEDWHFPDIREATFADSDRGSVRLSFDHMHGPVWLLYYDFAGDFDVEDDVGTVPIAEAKVEADARILLTLDRPAVGRTLCSYAYGGNPRANLRDEDQRPVLAFHRVAVE